MDAQRGKGGLNQDWRMKKDMEDYIQAQQRKNNPQNPPIHAQQERLRQYCQLDPKRVPLLQRRVKSALSHTNCKGKSPLQLTLSLATLKDQLPHK
jgi:hypothetical protein